MPGEREALLEALKDTFEGLAKGETYGPFIINYTPTHVVRVDGFDEAYLDTGRKLVYFVVAGEETDEPDTGYEFLATWEVFIVGVRPWKPDSEDPFRYQGELRSTVQNKMIDDMKAAITSVAADPPADIDDVDPADFRTGLIGDMSPFAYVECRIIVDYTWLGVSG